VRCGERGEIRGGREALDLLVQAQVHGEEAPDEGRDAEGPPVGDHDGDVLRRAALEDRLAGSEVRVDEVPAAAVEADGALARHDEPDPVAEQPGGRGTLPGAVAFHLPRAGARGDGEDAAVRQGDRNGPPGLVPDHPLAPLEVDLALAAARGIDGEDLALAHDDLQEVGERRRLEPGLGDGTEGSEGAE
jgi:hypothetical protein